MNKLIAFFVVYNVSLLPISCAFYEGYNCMRKDKSKVCVELVDCVNLHNEVVKAGNPMPSSIGKKLRDLTCGFKNDNPMVCCDSIDTSGAIIKESDNEIQEYNSRFGSPPDITSHPNLKLLPDACGVSGGIRIIGGDDTELYEMPWMVLLSYYDISKEATVYGCAGSLINEWYVLTAAHCVKYLPLRLTLNGVILGEYDTREDPDCTSEGCAPPVQNVTADSIIVHDAYTRSKRWHDIALIRLSEPANFSLDTMKPICLPKTKEMQREEAVLWNATAAGWGFTEERTQSPILKSVDLPIIPNDKCFEMYKKLVTISKGQFCAGAITGMDTCSGDSGGPMMYHSHVDGKNMYTQKGIVSIGTSNRCAIGDYPTLYTRVTYYMDWILDNIRE